MTAEKTLDVRLSIDKIETILINSSRACPVEDIRPILETLSSVMSGFMPGEIIFNLDFLCKCYIERTHRLPVDMLEWGSGDATHFQGWVGEVGGDYVSTKPKN